MGRLKHRLLFYGLSFSAYLSPIVMIISILTNYWLFSVERITGHGQSDTVMTSTVKSTTNLPSNLMTNSTKSISLPTSSFIQSNSTFHITLTTKTFESLGYIEASYGLWKICKITEQFGVCIIPLLVALSLMVFSVLLHIYSFLKKKFRYLYLISGCFFIFAGLASLTGIIVFIAAVNGAVDQKLTVILTGDDEPIFKYNYGLSFFGAVISFLLQEFNGICNIYWYIDYYRKYRFANENAAQTSANSMPTLTYRRKIEIIKEKEPMSKKMNAKKYFNKKTSPNANDAKMNKQEKNNFVVSTLQGASTLKRPLEKSNSQDSILLDNSDMGNIVNLNKSDTDITQSNYRNNFTSSNKRRYKKDFHIFQNQKIQNLSLKNNPNLPYPTTQLQPFAKTLNPFYSNSNTYQAWNIHPSIETNHLNYTKPYLSRSAIINSLSSSTPTPTPSVRSSSSSSQSSDCSSSLYTRSSSPVEKSKTATKFKNTNKKTIHKHIDLEENELKTQFYKLKQSSNTNSSSFSHGHKNREKFLKKYPSCDYHYYHEPNNTNPATNNNQRQRQASFRKENAPFFFHFSQDPSLSYENYLLNYKSLAYCNENKIVKTSEADQSNQYHRHHHQSVPIRNQNTNKKANNLDPIYKNQRTNYESYLKNVYQPSKLYETSQMNATLPTNVYVNKMLRDAEFIPSINSSLPPIAPNLKMLNPNKSSLKNQLAVDNFIDSKSSAPSNIKKEVKFVSKLPTSTIEYSMPESFLSEEEAFLIENSERQKKLKFENYQPVTKYVLQDECKTNTPNTKLDDAGEEDAQFLMKKLKRTTSV